MTADVRCDRENEVEEYTLRCDWNADGTAWVEVLGAGIAERRRRRISRGTICRCTTTI